CSQSTHVPWTF
nr:immunoglobulin light chain junction region [Mus musculus]NSL97075.1 immunoglobulin light chain junction region [Mus musculus]NSL97111.1 immunoglobulin light chain junction region [Mus musculus]NSL97621.1 immunoglobulin light chain junction region [Mus musculus]NSL97652.1 immunoglobulin light chain junction region [Mus musculus]